MTLPRRNPTAAAQAAVIGLIGGNVPDFPNRRCGDDPELWFPSPRGSAARAREACRGCEHRVACLERALSMPFNPQGVWGATTEGQRRHILERRAKKKAA